MKEEPYLPNIVTHRSPFDDRVIQLTPSQRITPHGTPQFVLLPEDAPNSVSVEFELEEVNDEDMEEDTEEGFVIEEDEDEQTETAVVQESVRVEKVEAPDTAPADEAAAEDEAPADEADADEEAAADEADADEQAAAEEDEETEVVKLGRSKKSWYHCGVKSKKLYEYIDAETMGGTCVGTYINGKLVPL
jgi:glucan-binding YG repeat protein